MLGGAETSVQTLAEGLLEAGHPTAILEFAVTKSQRRLPSEVPVRSIPRLGYPVLRHPRSLVPLVRSGCQFLSIIHEFKPDIVSVQYPVLQSLPVLTAHALPHKWKLVVTVHGNDIRFWPFIQPRLRPWQSRLFRQADAVTAVSESLRREVVRLYPFVRDKAHVIHNCVGPSWFQDAAETRDVVEGGYILFVGRFDTIKGTDILLRAWQLVQRNAKGLTLRLVGDGPELNNLRILAQELRVSESVQVLGRKQQQDLPSLYRGANLVVIPSRNEGLPLVALEAGACGSICVATNVGGLSEVIEHKVTGFLVEPESPAALADGILAALQLPVERKQRMSAAARKRIGQHFAQERIVARYEQLFQSLIGRRLRQPNQTCS